MTECSRMACLATMHTKHQTTLQVDRLRRALATLEGATPTGELSHWSFRPPHVTRRFYTSSLPVPSTGHPMQETPVCVSSHYK